MTRLSTMAVAAGIALASGAQAQDISTELPPEDRWTVTVAPYLWMLSLDGNTTVGGIKADVDVPFKDSIQDLSFGGMLLTTVRKGKLGFSINGVYTRVSPDNSVGPLDIDSTADLARRRRTVLSNGRMAYARPLPASRFGFTSSLCRSTAELSSGRGRCAAASSRTSRPGATIVGSRSPTDRPPAPQRADVGGVVTGSVSPGTRRPISATRRAPSAGRRSCRSISRLSCRLRGGN